MFPSERSFSVPIDHLPSWWTKAPFQHPRKTQLHQAMSPFQLPIPSSESKNIAFSVKWIFIRTTRMSDFCPSSRVPTLDASTADTLPDCARNSKKGWNGKSIGVNELVICRLIINPWNSYRIRSCSTRNDQCVRIIIRRNILRNDLEVRIWNKCVLIID